MNGDLNAMVFSDVSRWWRNSAATIDMAVEARRDKSMLGMAGCGQAR